MLDGYRRGVQTGGALAQAQPAMTGNDQALNLLARRVFTQLEQQGYAHLAPLENFITGFVDGFKQARLSSA